MASARKFFSLDNHLNDDLPVRDIFRAGSMLTKTISRIPRIPVSSLDCARHAWGIDDFTPAELEQYRVSRLHFGILAGILFCTMIFLIIQNIWSGTFGLIALIGYTFALLSTVTIGLIFFWQSDMLSGEPFVPFVTYVCKQKWLFSVIAVCLFGISEYTAVLAAPELPMPKAEIESSDDLASNFMQALVGTHWQEFMKNGATGTISLGPGMTSVLLPILGCLNSIALFFVTVFALYIFAFGTVQIANSGRWEDSQIFSTFWSPLRTVAAIALCTPLQGGISALHHLIMMAIALSFGMANNISGEFLKHVAANEKFKLSTPVVEPAAVTFPTFFTPLLETVILQTTVTNILGDPLVSPSTSMNIGPDKIDVKSLYQIQEIENVGQDGSVQKGTKVVIKFAGPKDFTMPRFILTINEKSNVNISVQYKAIEKIYTSLYALVSKYINPDMKKRGINTKELLDETTGIVGINKTYIDTINEYSENHLKNNYNPQAAIETFQKLCDGNDSKMKKYGWMTLGIYPFIIAQAQSAEQEKVAMNIAIEGSINFDELESKIFGGRDELPIIKALYTDVTKITRDATMKNAGISFGGIEEGSGWNIGKKLVNALMGFGGLKIDDIADELSKNNPIAVMYSKGESIMTVGAIGLTTIGVVGGIGDLFGGIASKIPGLGKIAEFTLDVAGGVASAWAPLLTAAFGLLFLFGALCCFFLPVLPMLYWARALVSWAVLVMQTMMGAPFWAAAHILPEGIGLAGQHARRGYIMLLDLFIRPTLLCCGIIMSMLLLETFTKILAFILLEWVEITRVAAGYTFLGYFILSIVFIYIIYNTIKWLFMEAIGNFPSTVIRWCGGSGLSEQGMQADMAQNMSGRLNKMTNDLMGNNLTAAFK